MTEFLAAYPVPASQEKPRLLIVPHAGYPYSGAVAASAYRLVQRQTYDGVVVVGFTHRLPFPGASVDLREDYETPLGVLPVDRAAVDALLALPGLNHTEAAHEAAEHSLEVQLPFLQVAAGRLPLIPILMGSHTLEEAEALAGALAELAHRGDYLFVFTTDLSHDHPDEAARELDERTINAMAVETARAADRLFAAGALEACGRGPILAALALADRLSYLRRDLLAYATSGDATGDRSRVVGYAALAMYDRESPQAAWLSAEAGVELVQAARQALERAVQDGPPLSLEAALLQRQPELSRASGIFVTLRKAGQLRGCIGRVETTEPLARSITRVAADAALRDHRFPPVAASELDNIQIEVAVLSSPSHLADARDLVPGRDGVLLTHQGRQGVFLPSVWESTGWTRVEFLRELTSQKAGLPPDAWRHATLFVFQEQLFAEP